MQGKPVGCDRNEVPPVVSCRPPVSVGSSDSRSLRQNVTGRIKKLSRIQLVPNSKDRKPDVSVFERARHSSKKDSSVLSVQAVLGVVEQRNPVLLSSYSRWFSERAGELVSWRLEVAKSISNEDINEIATDLIQRKVRTLNDDLVWSFLDAHASPFEALLLGCYEGETACYSLTTEQWPAFSKTELKDIKELIRAEVLEQGAKLARTLTEEEIVGIITNQLNKFVAIRSASLEQQLPALRKMMPDRLDVSQDALPFDAIRASLASYVFKHVDLLGDAKGSYYVQKLLGGKDVLAEEKYKDAPGDVLSAKLRLRLVTALESSKNFSKSPSQQIVRLCQWEKILEIVRDLERSTHIRNQFSLANLPIESLKAHRRLLDRWALNTRESGLDWTTCPAFNALRSDLEKQIADYENIEQGWIFPDLTPDSRVLPIGYMISKASPRGNQDREYLDIEERRAFAKEANRAVLQNFPKLASHKFDRFSWGIGFERDALEEITRDYRFRRPEVAVAWKNIRLLLEREGAQLNESELEILFRIPDQVAELAGSFIESGVDLDAALEELFGYQEKLEVLSKKIYDQSVSQNAPIATSLREDLDMIVRKCIDVRDAIKEIKKLRGKANQEFGRLVKLRDKMSMQSGVVLTDEDLRVLAYMPLVLYDNSNVPSDARRFRLELKRAKEKLSSIREKLASDSVVPIAEHSKARSELLRVVEVLAHFVTNPRLISKDKRIREAAEFEIRYGVSVRSMEKRVGFRDDNEKGG